MTTRKDTAEDNLDLLRKEYEIIQSKIDKIGEFKFKIRGWSITVLSAALAGLISQKMSSIYWGITFLIPVSFHYLEYEQEILSNALGRRAKNIEYLFFLLQRNDGSKKIGIQLKNAVRTLESTPRIAAAMGNARSKPIDHKKLLDIQHNLFFYTQALLLVLLYLNRA